MSGMDIAALRRMVCAIEGNNPQSGFKTETDDSHGTGFTLGHEAADAAFPYGIAANALHEVFADNAGAYMAATGFALGLAWRAAQAKAPVIWIEEERAESEYGGLYPPGLSAFGINPARLLIVRCPTAQDVLKATSDALETSRYSAGSHMISAIVTSITGKPKCLDLTASRRLLLASETAHVPIILLRSHRTAIQSAAVSRWRIAPAISRSSGANAPGKPTFAAVLERNRHGMCGQWIMEWNNENFCFAPSERTTKAPVYGSVVSFSADRQNTPHRNAG